MGFLGEKIHVLYHEGDGSGTDIEAHRLDHRTLVTTIPEKMKGQTVRVKRSFRPRIRTVVKDLMATSAVTGGDQLLHRDTAVEQINHWLPPYLQISARHIRLKP